MNIIELKEREDISGNVKLSRIYIQFQELLKELRKRELSEKVIDFVNQRIEDLNATILTGDDLRKSVKRKQTEIINLLVKELKIVPKHYYRNFWIIISGPIGVFFGFPIFHIGRDTGGLLVIVMGIAMAILFAFLMGYVFVGLDKKAFKEGRQLEVDLKY